MPVKKMELLERASMHVFSVECITTWKESGCASSMTNFEFCRGRPHSMELPTLVLMYSCIHPWRIYPSYGHWDDHFDDGYIRHMALNGLIICPLVLIIPWNSLPAPLPAVLFVFLFFHFFYWFKSLLVRSFCLDSPVEYFLRVSTSSHRHRAAIVTADVGFPHC